VLVENAACRTLHLFDEPMQVFAGPIRGTYSRDLEMATTPMVAPKPNWERVADHPLGLPAKQIATPLMLPQQARTEEMSNVL
jgi:hypothetical protein